MNLLLHHNKTPPPSLYPLRHPLFLNPETKLSLKPCLSRSPISRHNPISRIHAPLRFEAPAYTSGKDETFITSMEIGGGGEEDLSLDGAVYRKTLRLVECSMFAALAGLVYFLSNSLSIENYFGSFFPLPIVISSMRWGIAAGRKTMVATAMLLLVLSGPLKALTYLLTHGLLGLAIGSLWRLGASWSMSIPLCTLVYTLLMTLLLSYAVISYIIVLREKNIFSVSGLLSQVRAVGALGYVAVTSFLIKENILALITVNLHASVSLILTAAGINSLPSMNLIYTIFGIVLLLNSIFLVFLLHLLYSVFFTKLGMRDSLKLPRWLDKAI